MPQYNVKEPLQIPARANERYADLSLTELQKRGYRVIGGDRGDLRFEGFTVEDDGKTTLYRPVLHTSFEDLTDDEVQEIAEEVLAEAFDSIGAEAVEH